MFASLISRPAGFHRCFLLFIAVLIAGCAEHRPQPDRRYELTLTASGEVNHGAPLKIRLFCLSDKTAFMAAGYPELQDIANKVLAETLVDSRDIFLLPNGHGRQISLEMTPAVKYLGLFAEYKDMTHQRWRMVWPVADVAAPGGWRKFLPGSKEGATKQIIIVSPEGLRRRTSEADGNHE